MEANKGSKMQRKGSDPQSDELQQLKLDEKHLPYAWVVKVFTGFLRDEPDMSAAVAAVHALTEVIKESKANTMMGLEIELKCAADVLKGCHIALSVSSGCDLFTRFVTRTSLDVPDFVECRNKLIERGERYTKQAIKSRQRIGQLADSFIRDGVTVLTHGFSRVVVDVLLRAVAQGKRFSVLVTESRPAQVGLETFQRLQEAGIPTNLITDSAVAYTMEAVDLVLVGAEGIVENGGILNTIGTYQISIVANAHKKPFYVAAESFKFMRSYPLNQRDLRNISIDSLAQSASDITTHDYTPPSYITLLFTELGVLTPAAVSDELIKLYY